MKTFKSILEFQKHFPTDAKCREYLEQQRWNGEPCCPFCQSKNVVRFANGYTFKCRHKECRKQFTVTVGTVYQNTKLPLTKWFLAMYLLSVHSKGISSLQLAQFLDITQKSAWHLAHRIREMLTDKDPAILTDVIEIDATYFGGKLKNKHAWQRKLLSEKNGRGTGGKTPVLGLLERDGKVVAFQVESEAGNVVKPIIQERVDKSATVMTDAHAGYKDLHKHFDHVVINHQGGEYVKGQFHTNNIEGFWSILKRGIDGIQHAVSAKHINRYCNEYAFRYNERGLAQDAKFALALSKCNGSLKYQDLISAK